MRWVIKVAEVGFHAGRIWLILGFLLRISGLRDFTHLAQLPFYSMPWLVQAAGLGTLAWWDRRRSRRRLFLLHGAMAVVALTAWAGASWRWNPPSPAKADFRLMLWNVSRPEARLPRVAGYLRAHHADVIVLAEWKPELGQKLADWRRAFPGYTARSLPGNMLLLTKGKVTPMGTGMLEESSFYGLNRVQLGGREVLILQADLYSGPTSDREPAMKKLIGLIRQHSAQPLILAGDLNTPRDSSLFDPIRQKHRHAFETAGRGYAETWPLPLPVLSLDQVWVPEALEVIRCFQGVTPWSDHRPVIVDLRWRSP